MLTYIQCVVTGDSSIMFGILGNWRKTPFMSCFTVLLKKRSDANGISLFVCTMTIKHSFIKLEHPSVNTASGHNISSFLMVFQ